MDQRSLCKRFVLATVVVLGAAGAAEAALPPGDATAIIRKPPTDPAHFAITAPLLLEHAAEPAPDDDDPLDDDGPDEPIALWLFLGASLILPVSGIGAGLARRLPRRHTDRA
jgi:hypothetical protein